MTRRTIEDLITQVNNSLPDNNSGAIRPADVRNAIRDFLDTVTPMYGGLSITSRTQSINTTTPSTLVFQNSMASFPPEWTTDPAAGTLARQLGGVAAMTSRFTLNGEVAGSTNGDVTIELMRNGVGTGWKANVATRGTANFVTFVLDAIDYVTANATYSLKVSTRFTDNYAWQNVQFIGINVPVRSATQPPGVKLA